jgi:hypothetical protein
VISFMVLGGARNATTWAANWLTTNSTFCFHDPLLEYTKRNLDLVAIPGKAEVGLACTSTLLFPEWYTRHPARKIVLYREPDEMNRGLEALGLPTLDIPAYTKRVAEAVKAGIPIWHWDALFDRLTARKIWEHLLPNVLFDEYRHDLLASMNVQPQWKRLPVSKEAVMDLVNRTKELIV